MGDPVAVGHRPDAARLREIRCPVVEDRRAAEHQAAEDQERPHHPQVRAAATRIGLAIRDHVADGDGKQEETVEICVNGRLRQRDPEDLRHQRSARHHHHGNEAVVDGGRDRDRPARVH